MSLKVFNQSTAVPLKTLKVFGEFCDCLGEVTIKQSWINETSSPITADYTFRLDVNAVISKFEMSIGQKEWQGVVKAKETASAEYSAAVENGIKSSLLEKLRDNNYKVKVGPVDPAERVEIQFSYLTRVEVGSDGAFRFVLPTNIASKYISPDTTNASDLQYSADMASIPHSCDPGYSFELDIKWSSGSAILEVVSPTNGITTSILSANSVVIKSTTAPVNGDFVVCVKTEATTAAYSFESPVDQATYLYIHNRIPSEAIAPAPRKISILLDRSGSMGGVRIRQAVRAIKEFVTLLDESNLINIVCFGDKYQGLWSHHVPASAANKQVCYNMLQTCDANMGGTELFRCLSDVVSDKLQRFETNIVRPPVPSFRGSLVQSADNGKGVIISGLGLSPDPVKNLEHIVVLLTDGQVGNVNSVVHMLQHRAIRCRVMTIGIGADADRGLVQRIAEATNGISRMLVDELDLTAALTDIIGYIGKQYYVNVRVDKYDAVQCSKALYPAHPLDMFLRLEPEQMSEIAASGLTITADDPVHQCSKTWNIGVDQCVRSSNLIERLHANAVICQLEERLEMMGLGVERTGLVERIVALSVQYGLMNSQTSYLIVSDEQTESEEPVVHTSVPHHSSSGASWPPNGVLATHSSYNGCRTKQTARCSTGGKAPRKQLATKHARKSAPFSSPARVLVKRKADKGCDKGEYIPRKSARRQASAEEELKNSAANSLQNLLNSQLSDGTFAYSPSLGHHLMLGYSSTAQFVASAASADLPPALFFNMCVLVRLELNPCVNGRAGILRSYLCGVVKYFAKKYKMVKGLMPISGAGSV